MIELLLVVLIVLALLGAITVSELLWIVVIVCAVVLVLSLRR